MTTNIVIDTDKTIANARQWGVDKGITGPGGKGTIQKQFRKFVEEMAELFEALDKGDRKEIRDALGDLQVVAIQAHSLVKGIDLPITFEAYESLAGNDIEDSLSEALFWLSVAPNRAFHEVRQASRELGHCPDECLQEAYDIISKRTGKMVGGVFVKDPEPEDDMDEPLGQACQLAAPVLVTPDML